jgi:hypothetical protein
MDLREVLIDGLTNGTIGCELVTRGETVDFRGYFKPKQIGALGECLDSLNVALDLAGGRPYDFHELKDISAYHLVHLIAPNKIRFNYEEETNDNHRSTEDTEGYRPLFCKK